MLTLDTVCNIYRSHGHHWNVTSSEDPEQQARPHPDEEQRHPYYTCHLLIFMFQQNSC